MRRLGILAFGVALPILAAESPITGTWELNVAKSKFVQTPTPKSATLVIDEQAHAVSVKYEETKADGGQAGYEYKASMDGKESPVIGPSLPERLRGADTVVVRKNGSREYGGLFKKSGQVVMTDKTSVSRDGKTLIVVVNGVDAKGQPLSLMTVWDKR